MAKHDPEKQPLVPFALAPSARPPASGVHHAQVRVPAPPPVIGGLPLSSSPSIPDIEVDEDIEIEESGERVAMHPSTLLPPAQPMTPPSPIPRAKFLAPTVRINPERARRAPRPILLAAAGGLLAIALAFGVTVLVTSRATAARDARPVDDRVAAATTTAAETASAPATSATPASDAPSATTPVAAPKPFDRDVARRALDALAPKLLECKLPHGKAVRAKVTFAPSGEASSVVVLAPASGKGAACVASHLRGASVDAFDGAATSLVHTFPAR